MRSPRKLLKQLSLPRGERRRRSAENGTNQTAGSTSPRLRWAVEELKTVCSSESRPEFERTVLEMFETFIASESPLAINIDHDTRTDIIDRVENQDPSSFPDNIYERAQAHVYRLMEKLKELFFEEPSLLGSKT
ncbi:regulator of G protein signaling domain protein [Ancylostoma ceylanicum]|uniref:Regulator of G protein signaling domain protein n=1 Tax=Ancylostoma ceylanicum TaxID=53326 RepID=A0A0D6LGS3_9BILA|nr:regulator of G protein signaling domain protein [Ancylostoma ceylanicum]